MNKSLILYIILFLLSFNLWAAKTTINGKASGAEGLTIRLYSIEDYISNREILIDSSHINADGSFFFSLNLYENQVKYCFFKILNFSSTSLFAVSGKKYDLNFDFFDYKDPNRAYFPLLSPIIITYSITTNDSSDINYLISDFNQQYNNFILKSTGLNAKQSSIAFIRPKKSSIDSFIVKTYEKYENIANSFFKSYITYSLANLQLNLKAKSRTFLYDQYLYKKPILYNNIAYMDFFKNYFDNYILGASRYIKQNDIYLNINTKININAITDSLGKDSVLRNELLREAVLLYNIPNWYGQKNFKNDSLIKFLEIYARDTKFDLQAQIANNLIFMLTRFNSGNNLPKINFKSVENNILNNDSLIGKYTYILFFTTWSKASLSELLAMNKLNTEWKDSINFIAVSMDVEPLKLYYFLQDNKVDFPIYHFNNDYIMSENLELVTFPHSIFLDKYGKFIEYCAPNPSKGIVVLFNNFISKSSVRKQPNIEKY